MIQRLKKLSKDSDLTAENVEAIAEEISGKIPGKLGKYSKFGNLSEKRTLDVSTATAADVANVLGALIEDLRKAGYLNG